MSAGRNESRSRLAKGRTNYELHPEIYSLREGVAQTMTLFKPRLVTVHRSTCLLHHPQSAANGITKLSPMTTPMRVKNDTVAAYVDASIALLSKVLKDKSPQSSSTMSLTHRHPNSISNGDLSMSADELSISTHVISKQRPFAVDQWSMNALSCEH